MTDNPTHALTVEFRGVTNPVESTLALSHCANSLIYSVWISHIDWVTVIYEGEVESLTEYR